MSYSEESKRGDTEFLAARIDYETAQLALCHRNLLLYGIAVPYDPTTAVIDPRARTITFMLPAAPSVTPPDPSP
jgi:hypothetical protein